MWTASPSRCSIPTSNNRWYDAELGRWLQRDPAGYVDGMSLYLYALSNPLVFVDPLGLWGIVGDAIAKALGFRDSAQMVTLTAGEVASTACEVGKGGGNEVVEMSAAGGPEAPPLPLFPLRRQPEKPRRSRAGIQLSLIRPTRFPEDPLCLREIILTATLSERGDGVVQRFLHRLQLCNKTVQAARHAQ